MVLSISFSTAVTQCPANWWSKHQLSSIENEGIAANPFSFCYAFIGRENDPLQRRFLQVASNLCRISITRKKKSGKYIYVLEMRFLSLLWVLKSFWYLRGTKTRKRVVYKSKRKHMVILPGLAQFGRIVPFHLLDPADQFWQSALALERGKTLQSWLLA